MKDKCRKVHKQYGKLENQISKNDGFTIHPYLGIIMNAIRKEHLNSSRTNRGTICGLY